MKPVYAALHRYMKPHLDLGPEDSQDSGAMGAAFQPRD